MQRQNYGSVYAIQQMSVSLAYSLGPIIGGEMAEYMGFGWLMFTVGAVNITYGLLLLANLIHGSVKVFVFCLCALSNIESIFIFTQSSTQQRDMINLTETTAANVANTSKEYKRFYNTMDMP